MTLRDESPTIAGRDTAMGTSAESSLTLTDAVRVLYRARHDDEIVITSMGTSREWMALGPPRALDLVYVPSSMGLAPSLGLGLALAQPDRRVIVCNGDGSMLMNLGALVSITAAAPANLTLLLFDNGVYEVTGGQPTPAAPAGRTGAGAEAGAGAVDFTEVARGCGFESIHRIANLPDWSRGVRSIIDAAGPTFCLIEVAPAPDAGAPRSPGPGAERASRFMEALGVAG